MSTGQKKVVYVALGTDRVRAADRHTERLTADGATVELVVPQGSAWAKLESKPGVTVHRVAPNALVRDATRLLTRRPGLLGDADELVAGDMHALPVAWEAARRFASVPIRFEPDADHDRRPGAADLAVVTPWYPSPNDPFNGAFVKASTIAVRHHFDRVSILHPQAWAYRNGAPFSAGQTAIAFDRISHACGNWVVEDHPEGELTRVASPVVTGRRDYPGWVDGQVEMLRRALPTGQVEAPLIHAHTGVYGGWVATQLARPDARIIVTEHATFLPAVLDNVESKKRYAQMLYRIDALLCVGSEMRDLLAETFPPFADKLKVVPNVVEFSAFPVRPTPPRDLLRWVYIGRLIEHKGVHTVVDAFAQVAADEPEATLTLVGSGDMADALTRQIERLGLAGRARILPPVPPDEVSSLLHQHDLLVHASHLETFGLTIIEAIATGTPVLVARSAGPAETLAGLEKNAGEMFDVTKDPEVIVEAFRQLRKRLPDLDLAAARSVLQDRYGREAVANTLMSLYRPSRPVPVAAPQPARGEKILIVGIDANRNRIRAFAERMLDTGYEVELIAAEAGPWEQVRLDERVRLHLLGPVEQRRLSQRVRRALVYQTAGAVLDAGRSVARHARTLGPEATVARTQRGYLRVADAVDNRILARFYQFTRPRALWRIVRRDVLPQLDLSATRHIVVSGTSSVTIGWRLARRYPNVTVTTSLEDPNP